MKKNYKFKIIFIICIIMILNLPNIQAQKNVNVDFFHGRANMSIPIYNFTSKYLNVPVTLDYNQTDILIQDMNYNKGWEQFGWGPYSLSGLIPTLMEYNPGWVGLGWNLNAGGVITRSVNVIPDERIANAQNNIPAGNFYATVNDFDSIVGKLKDGSSFETGEDEFTFNFAGHHGTFLYYHGDWKVFSDDDVVITKEVDLDTSTGEYYISKLMLETPDGIIYTFGGSNAVEFTLPMNESNNGESRIATAWYLTRIESPEEDHIDFTYEAGNPSYSPITQQCTFSSRIKYYNPLEKNWDYRTDFSPVCVIPTDDQIQNLSVGNMIYPVFLKSISSSTSPVSIQFNRSNYNSLNYPGTRGTMKEKLDNIYIGGDQTVIQYALLYTDNTTETLKLNSIQESGSVNGGSATSLPAYQFLYNDNTATIAPQSLYQITYPTGGYSIIEYEKSYLDNRFRIKKLTSKSSAADKSFFTNYYYNLNEAKELDDEESGIEASAEPSVIDGSTGKPFLDQTPIYYLGDGYQSIFELKKETPYYSPSPGDLSWAFLKRPEIGYSSVWEVQSQEGDGGSIVTMGSTNYIFNNYWSEDHLTRNYASLAGKMDTRIDYNAAQQILSTCYYEYEERPEALLWRYFTKSYKFSYDTQLHNYGILGWYMMKDPRYSLSRKEEYKDGSFIVTTYTHNYSTNHLTEQNVIENKLNYESIAAGGGFDESNQTTTTTTYKYLDEFNVLNSDGTVMTLNPNLSHFEKNIPVETVVKKDGKIISAQFIKFKTWGIPESRTFFHRPYEVYGLEIPAPLAVANFTPANEDWTMDSHYKLKKSLEYDGSGNLLQLTNAGGSYVSYLYDSNYRQPLVELKNCAYQDLLNTQQTDPMKLRTLLPNAQITSYTYTPIGGITSVTAPNGVSVYKEYDGLGRLKYLKDNNLKIIKKMEYQYGIQ